MLYDSNVMARFHCHIKLIISMTKQMYKFYYTNSIKSTVSAFSSSGDVPAIAHCYYLLALTTTTTTTVMTEMNVIASRIPTEIAPITIP